MGTEWIGQIGSIKVSKNISVSLYHDPEEQTMRTWLENFDPSVDVPVCNQTSYSRRSVKSYMIIYKPYY